ncbi:MAG TPA: TIGR00366 family protein [Candidatus Acidoferrales bacterium]|jgi:short-chain fatty acids transporter|nr:TIGR00366 family protein [Candidatus Acidoferrales bacterium]
MKVESDSAAQERLGRLESLGIGLADWSQRWFPDAFVFALLALVIIFGAGLLAGSTVRDLVDYFGQGFWSLIPFTMQMAMIIIGGYVVAVSPPVFRIIQRLSRIPQTPRGSVAFVALFSMLTSLISWGLGLIFAALLAREVVKNVRGVDYRAIGAASYLGQGTVWALGFSSSAALLMATPGSIPASLLKISGVIPLKQTLYLPQSILTALIVMCSALVVAYLSAPVHSKKTSEWFGVAAVEDITPEKRGPATEGEWLEYFPLLSIAIAVIGFAYIARVFAAKGPLAALDLNSYNFMFLMAGLLLHWRPRSFTRAVNNAVPATSGVLIQFPFYGGIFGIVTLSPIARDMAHFFVRISSHGTFPLLVSIYSAVLGMFVPSGGSKWVIEAPYVLQAASDLHVHLGWVVQIYNASEALPNLINPFWMLPILGILKVRARDLVGFTALQFMLNSVLVLFLVWFFARTLAYIPPSVP